MVPLNIVYFGTSYDTDYIFKMMMINLY